MRRTTTVITLALASTIWVWPGAVSIAAEPFRQVVADVSGPSPSPRSQPAVPPAPDAVPQSDSAEAFRDAPDSSPEIQVPSSDALFSSDEDCLPGDFTSSAETYAFRSRGTNLTSTLIPAGSGDVGISTFNLEHVLQSEAYPRFLLAPRFALNLMDNDPYVPIGPGINLTDIPPRLYEVAIEATLVLPLSEKWSLMGSTSPSLFTDFHNTTSEAFRIPSRVVAFYQWSSAVTLAAGVSYLDREDISTIGYFGVLMGHPTEDWKAEILFPRARLAYRFSRSESREHWIYVAQEFIGGASWAMQHEYGMDDVVTYRDEKVLLGYEWMTNGRRSGFIEGGYVYDRELEFKRLGWGRLSSTGVLRMGMNF